jgi:hypothetical protein
MKMIVLAGLLLSKQINYNFMKLSGFSFKHINKACKETHVPDKKCSNSRHAKSEKCEFAPVNDHFEDEHNAVFGLFLHALNNACKETPVLDKKCSNSRHAKTEKCEFTPVNDHFEDKHNAAVGLFLHALNNACKETPVLDKKCSNSRHAKTEKCEFTPVNDHFEDKHNAVFGLFLHALNACKEILRFLVFDKKTSKTRLSKFLKPRSLLIVNDCFKNENNAVFGLFLQRLNRAILCSVIVLGLTTSCSKTSEIIVQEMQMELPDGLMYFSEELLSGEIADTKIEHLAFVGPVVKSFQLSSEDVDMFVFIKGNGQLKADTLVFDLVPESIAIPMATTNVQIEVPQGEVLHFVQFTKKLSEQDLLDMAAFPTENKYDIFFTRFDDCEPYTEKIKSPNTVSRTVLPADIIPRVSLGTVEAPGPDEVGAHEHGMLDQLFLGLSDNDIVVHADGASAPLKAYSLLHIPLGSSHGVTVGENKKMYYLWMDFFLTKEGQEWLKTHKPITGDKKDY